MQEKKTTTRTTKKQESAVQPTITQTENKAPEQTSVPTFTEEQVRAMISEALAKYAAENPQGQLLEAPENDGVVTIIWQAEVNDANELLIGPNGKYGVITGKHAVIPIQHRDFVGDFRTTTMQYFLKTRNLIVVDGLTDDERKVYGVEYKQGEYLEPAVYERLIEMGDDVLEIFPKLHPTWREMVATKFTDAYEKKTLKCSRETLLALNAISKKDYANLPKGDMRRKGAFYAIIHSMNAEDEMADDDV